VGEYRNRTTGAVSTQGELRSANKNISLPKIFNSNTCNALNVDPVLISPNATCTVHQRSVRDGVEQNANGDWVQKYVAQDMFAATTVDGVTTTKAQHEAAHQVELDAASAERMREKRDTLIATTDFYALSDVTMTSAMTTYRQALRDISSHSDWPNLEDSDWPTKP